MGNLDLPLLPRPDVEDMLSNLRTARDGSLPKPNRNRGQEQLRSLLFALLSESGVASTL